MPRCDWPTEMSCRKVQRYRRSGDYRIRVSTASCDGLTGPDDHGPMISRLIDRETLKKCKQVTQPASWCVAEVLGRSLRAVGSGLYKWLYKSNRLVNPSSNERRGDVGD
ncbi:beta-amyrin 28-oxidase-like [Dorcoceras hygrometricum]|uniref:Beta-amyrin 28-oxidase-like n=1 Tax=Dorcoceras hygrometricum TaxID=472368 RepID=A0A2Z7AAC7_9LAMI|nr:beta-amyrin 28-oxidase-like [Dorcoceras hygrometricum]